MHQLVRNFSVTALVALGGATSIAQADDGDWNGAHSAYAVTSLVSNLPGVGAVQDPVLQDAWGVAFSPAGSPFWVSNNATGCSTLYDGNGTKIALQVAIPLPGNVVPASSCHAVSATSPPNPAPAAPTGLVWNPSSSFLVPGTKIAASFIFDTEDGTISAWAGGLNPADNAVIAVDNSVNPTAATGAVYKGMVFGLNSSGALLFVTNFRAGTVEAYGPNGSNGLFTPVTTTGGFIDPSIPSDYAPFGIQNIDGDLFVTYAKQDASKHDDAAGPGRGFVDVFDTDGHLLRRFASRGKLNSPWGVVRASFAFGRYSGKILVGNFGNGRIGVYDNDGEFIDELRGADGKPLAIDGLWSLLLGGGRDSSSDTLFFTAGPNAETNGLFGTITPTLAASGW